MSDKINIFLASDDNYAKWLGVVVISLIQSSGHPLDIYIASHHISDKNKQKLKSLETAHAKINLFEIDEKIFDKCYHTKRFPIASLIRMVIASTLPNLDKIIWLDSDILVRGDLWNLFNTPMDGYLLAACKDIGCDYCLKLIGFDDGVYVNSGVLVMNLDLIRKQNIENKLLNVMSNQQLPFPDQDAINIVCHNQISELPAKYNSMREKCRNSDDVILHYVLGKPWKTFNSAWEYEMFWKIFKNSPWKNEYFPIRLKFIISQILSFIYRKDVSESKTKFILFNLPILKISKKNNRTFYSFLGIPLLKKII